MKGNHLDSWRDLNSEGRLKLVFERRFTEYGAYQIRLKSDRNTVRAMFMAPAVLALLFGSFWIHWSGPVPKVPYILNKTDLPDIRIIKLETNEPKPSSSSGGDNGRSNGGSSGSGTPSVDPSGPPVNPFTHIITGGGMGGNDSDGDRWNGQKNGQGHNINADHNGVISKPSHPASYPGGDKEFVKFIQSAFITPSDCMGMFTRGECEIQFIVSELGTLSDFSVVSENRECSEFSGEAIRVLKTSRRWVPAMHNGRVVKAWRKVRIVLEY